MNTRKISILLCVMFAGLMACEEYDDYINDYEFSGVYFSTQKPLRTIVANELMQFKVGVALAGKRENTTEEWVTYELAPELLADPVIVEGNVFTLLPEEYYTVSDAQNMIVPKGEFIGDVVVTLNRDAFTSDPLAHLATYALPLKLIETSADSILRGKVDSEGNALVPAKDYTVLVVKYISPLHGVYYHKGVEKELDGTGATISETVYNQSDLSKNQTWEVSTLGLDTVLTSAVGTSPDNAALKLTRNADNSVTIEGQGSAISALTGTGTYDEENRAFYLTYEFTRGGKVYNVTDTLIQRQAPEKDLRYEEW